ncbi:hypothetical protein Tco_1185586 [Tanacetum coccineum]
MSSYDHFGCLCCGGPFNGGNCPSCSSVGSGNEFVYDPNPYSYNETPNFFNQPPQYQYETYSCEFCGGNSHPGYDCQTGNTPVFDQGPCYNQDFGFNQPLHYFPSQPQQFPCENCGGLHENFQCQPLNQNFYEPNHCYNSNFSGFDQYQPTQFPEIHYPPQTTDTEILQARENLMETIQAFLKEYDHIPPEEKCMALLLAEERFLKIKQAMEEEQNQPEVMQELLLKLMKDLQILKGIQPKQAEQEEPAAQNFLINLNFPMADDDEYTVIYRKPKAITPDLPIEEPDNSLSMGDEHLNTILETEKSSVENLVPIPSEFKGISEDICDVPSCDNDHFDAECGLINSLLSRDISITSPKIDFLPEEFAGELDLIDPILPGIDGNDCDEDDFDEEEGENDNDILQIEDEILRAVEYILVSEDSIPPGIESDLDSEGDIIFLDNLLNDDPIPEYERFTFDIEPDAPVINNFDELNEDECFDPGGGEIDVSQNIEDDDSFAFVIRTFLPYRTYPVDSPLLLSTGSEDTIFDPGIST